MDSIWLVIIGMLVVVLALLVMICIGINRLADKEPKGATREDIQAMIDGQSSRQDVTDRLIEARLDGMSKSVDGLGRVVADEMKAIKKTVDDELSTHLEKKLDESFLQVQKQLEAVYKGLGEMQGLAQGVGDLKKVLSNVKTRGILGEVQLRSIIEDMMAPGQYEENVATVKGSSERVEFAVKLPVEDGSFVWLPIDSKFPGDTYMALQDAYGSGDKPAVDAAAKALCARLKQEAKDIRDKYVQAPGTTEFGIMFLPFEGLYAEAVNRGMVEVLQRDYRVNVVGPSTMAAMLSSLQMSFRTIAIQKRSSEVWEVLAAVQTEMGKFGDVLGSAIHRIDQAGKDLEALQGTRMKAIQRKLRGVGTLPEEAARDVLELEE